MFVSPRNDDDGDGGGCLLQSFWKLYLLHLHITFVLIQWADLCLCESGREASSEFRNHPITDWQSECRRLDIFLLSPCWSSLISERQHALILRRELLLSFSKPVIAFSWFEWFCEIRCSFLQRTNSDSYGPNSSDSWIDAIGPKNKRFMWVQLISSHWAVHHECVSISPAWQRRATSRADCQFVTELNL